MKRSLLLGAAFLASCQPQQDNSEQLKSTIDALQKSNEECGKAKLDLESANKELEVSKSNLMGSLKDLEKQVAGLQEQLKAKAASYRRPVPAAPKAKPEMHDGGKVKDIEKLGEGLQGASGSK